MRLETQTFQGATVCHHVPFPRSAIFTVIFSMPSNVLEVVEVSAKLCWGDSPDMIDVESFGSEEIGSPEPAGFVVDDPCNCEDEELAVEWSGAIWVSSDGPGGCVG